MIPVIGILALDVGEICRRRIETVREKLRDKKCDRRLCAQGCVTVATTVSPFRTSSRPLSRT